MASNKDFINILREVRGTGAPGEAYTDGIWYELAVADIDGNPGIYGDILAKYGVVVENTATLNQAVAIIDGLTVVANGLAEGATPTASLIGTTLTLGIPVGATGAQGLTGPIGPAGPQGPKGDTGATGPAGADGVDGHTPTQSEIDAVVSTNVNVLAAQTLLEDTITDATIAIDSAANNKIAEYDVNAADRLQEYDSNHTTKLADYNANDTLKMDQYNVNHVTRLEEINYAYADRIIEMIKTRNFMGIMDEYVAQTETHMIPFLSTDDANYIYYGNGTLLELGVDYTVYDSTTIELVVKANPYDVIVQVNTQVLNDMFTAEGVLFEDRIGQPNGVAGLDANGTVPSAQLPSYVDDVIEVAIYADLPAIGEKGKIYIVVADETSNGDTSSYRWTGTVYAMVSNTLTAADVKSLYESNLDTNAYTDAEQVKVGYITVTQAVDLDNIESDTALNSIHRTSDGTDHTYIDQDVTTTSTPTFAGIITDGLIDGRDVSVDGLKLDGIEEGATADQTPEEIKVAYESNANTNVYTDTEKAKVGYISVTQAVDLDSIESTLSSHTLDTANPHGVTKAQVGLGNADNTADSAKNVLSATKLTTARTINGVSFNGTADITIVDSTKAPLASPALTGTPTAPTAAVGTNTTQVATTAFVLANSVNTLADLGLTATATELNYVDGVTSAIQTQLNAKLATTAKAADSDLLDGLDSLSFLRSNASNATATGLISTSSSIEAGRGSGSLAWTMNDGYGNSNLCFNHKNGIPDVTGSSGRISCAVDGATANMSIQLKDSTTSGVAVALTEIVDLSTTAITLQKNTTINGTMNVTGTATAPTAAVGTNTTQIATTEFVLANSVNTLADLGLTATATELNYVDGVTSAIQTQLNAKANLASPTFTGTVVLPSTTSIGTITNTELSYLDGVTSSVQTQLNGKAPLASPTFTGTPTAPTPTAGDNTTKVATTAFVKSELGSALDLKANLANPTFTGNITTDNKITAGQGSGSVALTVNDGGGHANVTFNHANMIPDANGSSARISSDVDGSSANMLFTLYDNVTAGTSPGDGITPLTLTTSGATLSGVPTAPTAPIDTNNTSIATTAFVKTIAGGTSIPAVAKLANGYMKLANGIIIQWGVRTNSPAPNGSTVITFPIAFPTAFLSGSVAFQPDGTYGLVGGGLRLISTTGMTARWHGYDANSPSSGFRWIAIGY